MKPCALCGVLTSDYYRNCYAADQLGTECKKCVGTKRRAAGIQRRNGLPPIGRDPDRSAARRLTAPYVLAVLQNGKGRFKPGRLETLVALKREQLTAARLAKHIKNALSQLGEIK